jgi:hypothetical protein
MNWNDLLAFRKMITPIIIKGIFWIGSIICVIAGIVMMSSRSGYGYDASGNIVGGILMLLLGPFFVRIWCELMIVLFQINDTLTDIRNNTKPK